MAASRPIDVTYDDVKHAYTLDGAPVPSVTQILDKSLPKPALTWWGMRVGMAAVTELLRRGRISYGEAMACVHQEIVDNDMGVEGWESPTREMRGKTRSILEHFAILEKLTTNHITSAAADRGTSIHDALNRLALGELPTLADFPVADRGFVQALVRWWLEHEPEFVAVEQIVASRRYGYAGRFDLLVKYPDSEELVLADLKTGKDVRPDSHFRQLQGYKTAWQEMGRAPIDRMEIINCRQGGEYVVAQAKVAEEHWLACVRQFYAVHDFECLQKGKPPRFVDPQTRPQLEVAA